MDTVALDTEWETYLAYLKTRGYEDYAEHKTCDKRYGVNGSAGYFCKSHRVKVMPAP